jgi:PadR family transcriptional regulator PadR
MGRRFLGEFEQLVLLAVGHLGEEGYGVTIRREIERRTRRSVTIGAVYATLDRLEEKGYVASREGETAPYRGGRSRRLFKLSTAGVQGLKASRRMLDAMWEGLELPSGARRA